VYDIISALFKTEHIMLCLYKSNNKIKEIAAFAISFLYKKTKKCKKTIDKSQAREYNILGVSGC
jgi:hypothetical protein